MKKAYNEEAPAASIVVHTDEGYRATVCVVLSRKVDCGVGSGSGAAKLRLI